MAYQCWVLQLVLLNESCDIIRHGDIVMMRIVWRVAMVSEVLYLVNVEQAARHFGLLTTAYTFLPRSLASTLHIVSLAIYADDVIFLTC